MERPLDTSEGTEHLELVVGLVLLEHHFGRLDYDSNCVSLLKSELFRAASCDHAFDLALSNFDDDMGHDVPESHLHNFSFELVSRRYRHDLRMPRTQQPELRPVKKS